MEATNTQGIIHDNARISTWTRRSTGSFVFAMRLSDLVTPVRARSCSCPDCERFLGFIDRLIAVLIGVNRVEALSTGRFAVVLPRLATDFIARRRDTLGRRASVSTVFSSNVSASCVFGPGHDFEALTRPPWAS